jgi:hypothetical protein
MLIRVGLRLNPLSPTLTSGPVQMLAVIGAENSRRLNAVEIFKECHTSKKKGMTDQVKETVVSPYTSLPHGLMGTYVNLYS